MSTLPVNPYKVLDVSRNAEIPEIRLAYRKMVLKCHPDKVTDPIQKAEKAKEFDKVQKAYEILSDNEKRIRYDTSVLEKEDAMKMRRAERTAKKTQPLSGAHGQGYSEPPEEFHSRKEGGPGILIVHGLFEDQTIYAIPDTGAEYNMIAGSLVDKFKLRDRVMQPITPKPLRMANGQHTFTSGVLKARWRFRDGSPPWKVIFHILEDFVYDLVLGNRLLMKTQTMSHNKHRLCRIPRPMNALSVLRVNLLGTPSQRLRGFLDDTEILALPDSGSEPNLLSLEFLRSLEWQYKINTHDRRLLQFADGSTTESEGSIKARWHFVQASDPGGEGVLADFHILRDCAYDVILGQDVLEETDAFLQHEEDFVYVDSDVGSAAMIWCGLHLERPREGHLHPTQILL